MTFVEVLGGTAGAILMPLLYLAAVSAVYICAGHYLKRTSWGKITQTTLGGTAVVILVCFIVAVMFIAAASAIDSYCTERGAVERDIRAGIAAESPLGDQVFRWDLDLVARGDAKHPVYSIIIKPGSQSPWAVLQEEIRGNQNVEIGYRYAIESSLPLGLGVVDLGDGRYSVALVADEGEPNMRWQLFAPWSME